jgi:biotin synthase
VHTLVGLGESDRDLVSLFIALRDQQVYSYLFCFNPEPGSAMARHPKPTLRRWRRLQLARQLIESEAYELGQFGFGANGQINALGASRDAIDAVVATGSAFMTNGCPGENGEAGCTRPYGSYRPAEPFRDYPFLPGPDDLEEICQQLQLVDLVQA